MRTIVVAITACAVLLMACGQEGKTQPGVPAQAAPIHPTTGIEGSLDVVTCSLIGGWAMDWSHPNDPVEVELMLDQKVIARTRADGFRKDLVDAGKGNGYHTYRFPPGPEVHDGIEHQVNVRVVGQVRGLVPSPASIRCSQ